MSENKKSFFSDLEKDAKSVGAVVASEKETKLREQLAHLLTKTKSELGDIKSQVKKIIEFHEAAQLKNTGVDYATGGVKRAEALPNFREISDGIESASSEISKIEELLLKIQKTQALESSSGLSLGQTPGVGISTASDSNSGKEES